MKFYLMRYNEQKLEKIKVLLVGDGPLEENLKSLATEKGINNKVEF